MEKPNKFIKNIFKIIIFFFGLISYSYGFQNKILFKIDNEIITSIDILNEIEYRKLINSKISELSNEEIFEIAKKSLIKEKIRKITNSKFFTETEIGDQYLDPILNELINKSGFKSKEKFQEFLDFKNIKIDIIIDKIKTEILWKQLVFSKFSKNIKIDKTKIKNKILKNNIQKNYLLSEIVFNLENENLNEKYNKIKNEIYKNGFENSALKYSISDSAKDGGKLGWIKFSALNKNIQKELLIKNDNDFTNPIVIPGGFLILKIESSKNTTLVENVDLEVENISRSIASKQLNQFSNIYFNKLKKEFIINEIQ